MTDPQSFYDEVGGAPVFEKIVSRFYEEVAADEVLRGLIELVGLEAKPKAVA